jgi:hypothetical protein
MKALTVIGTAAMFLVGGGIIAHGIGPLHHLVEQVAGGAGMFGGVVSLVLNAAVGVVGGARALLVVKLFSGAVGALRGSKS